MTLDVGSVWRLAAAFVVAAVVANLHPFARDGSTQSLTALHPPPFGYT